jgi:hypothetical protein
MSEIVVSKFDSIAQRIEDKSGAIGALFGYIAPFVPPSGDIIGSVVTEHTQALTYVFEQLSTGHLPLPKQNPLEFMKTYGLPNVIKEVTAIAVGYGLEMIGLHPLMTRAGRIMVKAGKAAIVPTLLGSAVMAWGYGSHDGSGNGFNANNYLGVNHSMQSDSEAVFGGI